MKLAGTFLLAIALGALIACVTAWPFMIAMGNMHAAWSFVPALGFLDMLSVTVPLSIGIALMRADAS
jgi:hypothetical protein